MPSPSSYCGRVIEHAPPEDFLTALLSLREAAVNPLIDYEEVPPPERLAPWTAALSLRTRAEDHSQPLSSGRFVVLHDPQGQPGWNGTWRLVAHLRSQIDTEMGTDPLLPHGVWEWAHDCFDEAGAGFHDLTGTVTRELSESFGGLTLMGASIHVELRASWSPNTAWLGEHLNAWTLLMCRTSGTLLDHHLEVS